MGSAPADLLPQGLLAAAQDGRPAHAYILYGLGGRQAYQEAAAALAQTLNCTRRSTLGRACLECSPCLRIAQGVHPDVRTIAPEGNTLGIEQVRMLLKDLSLRPVEGPWRVFLVLEAFRMTTEGANRLLKILEEPPDQTVIILAVEYPAQLPDTIVSRCQAFILGRPSEDALTEKLMADKDLSETEARYLARLAGADPAVAEALWEAGALGQLRETVTAAAEKLLAGDLLSAMEAADLLAGCGDDLEKGLLILDALWRDLCLHQRGVANGVAYQDDLDEGLVLLASGKPLNLEALLALSARWREALAARVGRQLACDAFCLKMAAVLAGRERS